MFPTMTPEMLHGVTHLVLLFFTLVCTAFGYLFLARA